MYACREAVCRVMPQYFPYAQVILLCDNKNLSGIADSQDLRVWRWQRDVIDAGCVVRYWKPGEWNTIADYGSRTVVSDETIALTEEETHEMYIYGMTMRTRRAAGGAATSSTTTKETATGDTSEGATIARGASSTESVGGEEAAAAGGGSVYEFRCDYSGGGGGVVECANPTGTLPYPGSDPTSPKGGSGRLAAAHRIVVH